MKNKKNTPKEHSHPEGNLDPQEIESRAYQLYQERDGEAGRDCEDWLQAECELKELRRVAVSV